VLLDAIRRPDAPPASLKKMDAYAVRYPTNVIDIARALCDVVALHFKAGTEGSRTDLPPTLHFSAMEAMSKYDMSMVLARVWDGVHSELAPDADQIATTEFLDPEYEVDPSAATSRPRHCKLDLSVIKDLGISTECVGFETWWKEYLSEVSIGVTSLREG
jgi:sorting nexin-1/2